MKIPSEQHAIDIVIRRLADLLHVSRSEIRLKRGRRTPRPGGILRVGPFTFVVQWKGTGHAGSIAGAIEQVRHFAKTMDGAPIPLIAVPYMGNTGRERCAKADVTWMDLSGNARIIAPGLHIHVEGKPNRYRRPGRPSSVFAPKSSRISRWLLMHHDEWITQREIANATETDEGYTSKIVSKLASVGLIVKNGSGALKPRDPELLLDAWQEAYNFSKHDRIQGHVAARAGDVALRLLADKLEKASVKYAATGLGAAWLMDHFAGFRLATLYLDNEPSQELLDSLAFRQEERGANVWLVIPKDEGVFQGAETVDGVRCVHPVQVYLDLKAHPERASEAAQHLRRVHMNWRTDD